MTSSNPTLGAFGKVGAMGINIGASDTMTVAGTISKTGLLGLILSIAFALTWHNLSLENMPTSLLIYGSMIGGLVVALVIIFKPTMAPYLSPAYAALEGMLLGAFSFVLELRYPGIALQAASLTIAVLFAMLIAYRTGLIVVNNMFRAVIGGAIMGIAIFYVVGLVLYYGFGFLMPGIGIQSSWLSIGITLVIAVVASLSLALDFDDIAKNAGSAPKYMEWYGAFSLMVTLVWLYITLLRLLASLRGRD